MSAETAEHGAEPSASHGIIEDAAGVTALVLAAMSRAPDDRLREVMAALVRHLHAFAREVRLSEAEYEAGIEMLNRIGQNTNATHNEGILFADVLGFSTLICLLNSGAKGATETASALLGPFWRDNSPAVENGASIVRSPTPGPALFVNCQVTDTDGHALAKVEVDVWHASPVGLYENQDTEQVDMNLRGRFVTDAEGRFSFRSIKPAGYPVPTHGPAGALLRAQKRHPYRPAHLHFMCFKPGFKTLITQVFTDDDPYLESDVVFGVTRHLVGDYRRHDDGAPPEPGVVAPWYSLNYTFVLEPGDAKRPVPPIQ